MKKTLLSLLFIACLSGAKAQTGAALNFDGVDDYFKSDTSSALALAVEGTVEGWFRTSSDGEIIRLNTPADYGMEAGLSGGKFYFNAYLGGWNNFTWSAGPALNDGAWHHFAMVAGGTMAWAYVDGVLTGSVTGSAPLNTGAASVHVGSHPALLAFFNGDIDEVRVWNRALCLPEIQNNMTGELMLPQSGLVAYYRLNQGDPGNNNSTVTSATDSSGNGMDGVLTNFTLSGATSNWIATGAVTSGTYAPAFVLPTACITADTAMCVNDTLKLSTCGGPMASYAWFGPGGFFANTDTAYIPMATSANNGVYTLVVSDANGCNGNASVNITVNPYPVLQSQSGPIRVCSDTPGLFSVNSPGNNTYTWYWYSLTDTTTAYLDNGFYGETGYTTDSLVIPDLLSSGWDNYGVYCVITNAAGCSIRSVGDSIHAYNAPSVLASVTTATLCNGFSDTLTASGADTYTWSANAGSSVNDSAFVSPTSNATYTLIGTVAFTGCTDTSTVSITVISCSTGLKQNGGNNFTVYPNPSNGYFTVESATGEMEEVRLYDINGRLLMSRAFMEKTTIDASALSNGTYNLSILSSGGIFNKRIVINK